jgi:nitrogen fixation/metabolism regulation signal transduction histidine kinase
MKIRKLLKKENILLTIIIIVFSFYFAAITFFTFTVELSELLVLETLTHNRLLLITLLLLFSIMLFLVVYNTIQIVIDRVKNREGSKFRLRLTLFFLLITLISIVPLSLISNNLISKSINLWFVKKIEASLIDALEVSKELYQKLSEESVAELEALCGDCELEEVAGIPFKEIDGLFSFSPLHNRFENIYLKDNVAGSILLNSITGDQLPSDTWKRVTAGDKEYLIIPVKTETERILYIVRLIPEQISDYAVTISDGLQYYSTLKIIRQPNKVFIILFFLVITLPFILLAFYLSLIISRQVTAPIGALARATQRVAEDDLEYSIKVSAKDELKLLVDSFNRMTNDLRVNKELLKHSERSAAWRDIARRIAHEIKNPLTPIKLSAERILKLYKKNDRYREVLTKGINTIITEVENINEMVNEFSHFARFPDTKLGKHDIIATFYDILEFLRDTHRDIEFNFTHDEKSVYLLVDGPQVRRALLNVIYNSISAIQDSGIISVDCYPKDRPAEDKNRYIIAISDNGGGIETGIRDKIFDPYFSKNSDGSGLGLAIVEKIVLDNRGRIWFESRPGKTTFFLEFGRA